MQQALAYLVSWKNGIIAPKEMIKLEGIVGPYCPPMRNKI